MSTSLLPTAFADLEIWAAWSLPTEAERSARRQAVGFAEIEAFYHAMLARIDAALGHLDQSPVDDLPEAEQRLMDLCLALAEVAPAVEQFRQAAVVDGFAIARVTMDRLDGAAR
jgi:hypothetical protein